MMKDYGVGAHHDHTLPTQLKSRVEGLRARGDGGCDVHGIYTF